MDAWIFRPCLPRLREIAFDKWAIVELDRVPDPGRTPKESAEMNKRYLIDKAGQTL